MEMNYSFKLNANEKKAARKWVDSTKKEYVKGQITKDLIFGRIKFAKEIIEDSINEKGIENVGGYFPYTYEAHKMLLKWLIDDLGYVNK